MAENENFKIVGSRKRGKRVRSVIGDYNKEKDSEEAEFDVDKFDRKLKEAKDELNISEYKNEVFRRLDECLKLLNVDRISEIICYGLGHFSEHRNARYQLALLLIIKDHLKTRDAYIYDPLFFNNETRYLESLGFRVLRKNEEAKRKIKLTTLVYLPHCPKQLTNNFLYANWSPNIKYSILFSNSFKLILDSHTSDTLNNAAKYIARINPFVVEIELRNSFKYTDIFNDSSLHIFVQDNLKCIPISFWDEKEEPVYQKDDIEFITNSIPECMVVTL